MKASRMLTVPVVTYQLAYDTGRTATLCRRCVDADDHDRGALGPVDHGEHEGLCQGSAHPDPSTADACED
jgi:hypothetical protein